MKLVLRMVCLLLVAVGIAGAQDTTAATQDDKGAKLLQQMVDALGGQRWLDVKDYQEDGRVASFEHGQPTGGNTEYFHYYHLPSMERIEYARPRDLMPGSVKDVTIVWTADNGYEVTFKGKKALLPKDVAEYKRLRAHAIRTVVTEWMKRPGVIVVAEGTAMVERRIADKFTVLSPDNDAVTIFTEQTSHLPLRRTFEWRNPIFNDKDQEVEEYEDYHLFDGLPSALSITRYHNGEMNSQRYLTRVMYGKPIALEKYDPDQIVKKK